MEHNEVVKMLKVMGFSYSSPSGKLIYTNVNGTYEIINKYPLYILETTLIKNIHGTSIITTSTYTSLTGKDLCDYFSENLQSEYRQYLLLNITKKTDG